MQPKVTVILPVYNVEKYLPRCMDSLLSQTLKDIEIIAVNDGSSDASLDLLKEYALKDSRVQILNQINGGAGKARNAGLDVAKGEYLSFLDSDDFFEPDMLEEAYQAAMAHDADISAYQCDYYEENEKSFVYHGYTLRMEHLPPYAPFNYRQLTANVFRVFIGWAWDKLFKREFIQKFKLRFQEQRTTNDLYFVYSSLVLAKRIVVVPKILIHQRRDAKDSLSKTREKSWDNFYYALLALRKTLYENNIYEELEKDFIRYALHFCMWNYRTLAPVTKGLLKEALLGGWFDELGIDKQPACFFHNIGKKDYQQYQKILLGKE